MITKAFADQFAAEWVHAWNLHDIELVLSHYTDDFSIQTPIAAQMLPESLGTVTGKDNVRSYWTTALQRIPDLKFELIDVLCGVDGLTIYYVNTATGRRSAEMLFLNAQGKVYKAIVHYS